MLKKTGNLLYLKWLKKVLALKYTQSKKVTPTPWRIFKILTCEARTKQTKNLKHREYIKTVWKNQGNTKTQGRISKRTENGWGETDIIYIWGWLGKKKHMGSKTKCTELGTKNCQNETGSTQTRDTETWRRTGEETKRQIRPRAHTSDTGVWQRHKRSLTKQEHKTKAV